MAIALEGWLDGITASLIVFFGVIFGLFFIYKSIKLKAKLLFIAGINVVLTGFLWLGPTTDFLIKLSTGDNTDPVNLYVLLSYMWVAPALFFAMYLGGELLLPQYKWYLVGTFVVLGVVFEYFLWFHTSASFTDIEVKVTDGLLNTSFNRTHPTYFIVIAFLVATLIFLGIGMAVKAKQATGLLRKKFAYLSIGYTIFVVVGTLEAILDIALAIGIIRILMTTYALWMYLGLKT